MQCPHCLRDFHVTWNKFELSWRGIVVAVTSTTICPACEKAIITLEVVGTTEPERIIYPRTYSRAPVPQEVPAKIAEDYIEACQTLSVSPKASAALSRRCLQSILHSHGYKGRDLAAEIQMLHSHGYKGRDLAAEIQMLLDEPDTTKAIPVSLRQTIDGIRHFGNFAAHPVTDVTSLQIIDVEPYEAEQSLETVEGMFEHFYVQPALAKKRKADLDAKLAAAGKRPSKS